MDATPEGEWRVLCHFVSFWVRPNQRDALLCVGVVQAKFFHLVFSAFDHWSRVDDVGVSCPQCGCAPFASKRRCQPRGALLRNAPILLLLDQIKPIGPLVPVS